MKIADIIKVQKKRKKKENNKKTSETLTAVKKISKKFKNIRFR